MEGKAQAMKYFQENQVPLRMQDVLNILYKIQPSDVNGFVSTYFEDLSFIPSITKVETTQSLDSKGQDSLRVKIYCTVRNKEVPVGESFVCIDSNLSDTSRPEDRELETELRKQHLDAAANFINENWKGILSERNPKELEAVEEELYQNVQVLIEEREAAEATASEQAPTDPQPLADDGKKKKSAGKGASAKKKGPSVVIVPDEPHEKPLMGWQALSALSKALVSAGTHLEKVQPIEFLTSSLKLIKDELKLPMPAITLIQGGKTAPGKSNCIKEYMIVPKPGLPMAETIRTAIKIHETLLRTISVKAGPGIRNLNDIGAICATLDKPEQGMDMIIDAANQCGVEFGTNWFFILNIQAQEFFDYEKGKYEVSAGVVKAPDDMGDFWADLINRYPAVIGIIEPVRCEEKVAWNKVCSSVSARCLVFGDRAYKRPGILRNQQLDFYEQATSGIVLRQENINTITHLIEASKKMQFLDNQVMFSASRPCETNDTLSVDIAVACQARFIRLGGVSRGERMAKYNRLIDLEQGTSLRTNWDALVFPDIPPRPPTPPKEVEGQADGEAAAPTNASDS